MNTLAFRGGLFTQDARGPHLRGETLSNQTSRSFVYVRVCVCILLALLKSPPLEFFFGWLQIPFSARVPPASRALC